MTLSIDSVKRWWRNGNGEHAVIPVLGGAPSVRGELPPPAAETTLPPREPWKEQWCRFGIPHTLNYPSTTLGRMLDQTADRFGQCVALRYNHTKRWTYQELRAEVNRLAAGLAD